MLKELRLRAGFSQNKLAREADLDRNTVAAAEKGKDVQELSIVKIIQVLSRKLDENITIESVTLR